MLPACNSRNSENATQPASPDAAAVIESKVSTQLIPRAIIFGNPDRTLARISPDGAHVSWLAPKDGVMNVWVAPADDPANARVITRDDSRGIQTYSWAPNNKYVYYTQDQGGDENFHVYSANIETGEVADLTPIGEGARAVIEAVSAERPDHLVVGINERNPQVFDAYLVDVTTGTRKLLMENPGYIGWLIDNNLEPRFGFAPTPDGGGKVVDFDGGVIAEVLPEDFLTTQPIGFNQANDAIYMIDSRNRDKAALTIVSLETGKTTMLAESAIADISGVLTDARTSRSHITSTS